MNFRTPLSVLAFVAFAAPLAAHADAPSGDFYELFPVPSADVPADKTAAAREDGRKDEANYAEFSIWDMAAANRAPSTVTRDDVRKELASSPLPRIEA